MMISQLVGCTIAGTSAELGCTIAGTVSDVSLLVLLQSLVAPLVRSTAPSFEGRERPLLCLNTAKWRFLFANSWLSSYVRE